MSSSSLWYVTAPIPTVLYREGEIGRGGEEEGERGRGEGEGHCESSSGFGVYYITW